MGLFIRQGIIHFIQRKILYGNDTKITQETEMVFSGIGSQVEFHQFNPNKNDFDLVSVKKFQFEENLPSGKFVSIQCFL